MKLATLLVVCFVVCTVQAIELQNGKAGCNQPSCYAMVPDPVPMSPILQSTQQVHAANNEIVSVPIKVFEDKTPTPPAPKPTPTPPPQPRSESSESSHLSGDDIYAGVPKVVASLPEGVTITTTRNVGAQSITTTITKHVKHTHNEAGPVKSSSSSSSEADTESSESSLPVDPREESSQIQQDSSSSESAALASGSLALAATKSAVPSLDAIKIPDAMGAVIPLAPSGSGNLPVGNSNFNDGLNGAPSLSDDLADNNCAGGCVRRGKVRINSKVEISIGGKKKK